MLYSGKFAELRSQNVTPKQKTAQLINWWKEKGYALFLTAMKQKGVHAGDLELVALADYLHLNLVVKSKRPDAPVVALNAANGGLPTRGSLANQAYRISQPQIRELQCRGVAENSIFTQLTWEPLSKEEFEARVSAVPQFDTVHDYIEQSKPANGSPIPIEWKKDKALIEQLSIRGVITNDKFVLDNTDDAKRASMLVRIDTMENKAFIVSAREQTYRDAPVVALLHEEIRHEDGRVVGHYDALVSPALIAKDESKAIIAKPSSTAFFTETLQLLESGKVQPSQSKWASLVQQAQKEEANVNVLPVTEKVTYDFGATERKIATTKETAKQLDEELAKKVQQEEYQTYLTCSRQKI